MACLNTPRNLEDACEALLRDAAHPSHISSRRIAERAGTTASAINHHFGTLEGLILAVGSRVYLRLNAERLSLLQAAVTDAAPRPPRIADVIAALVGPSIRWSLEPGSGYAVLRHMTSIAQSTDHPEIFRPIVEEITPHEQFRMQLLRIAPWLSPAEVGFRISAILGIRSQVIRSRDRTEALTVAMLDLSDPDQVVQEIIAVSAPMFLPPSNSVRKASRP